MDSARTESQLNGIYVGISERPRFWWHILSDKKQMNGVSITSRSIYLPFIQALVWDTAMLSCERFTGFVDIFAYKFDIAIFFVSYPGAIHIITRPTTGLLRSIRARRRRFRQLADVRHGRHVSLRRSVGWRRCHTAIRDFLNHIELGKSLDLRTYIFVMVVSIFVKFLKYC